jgi:predicted nuclease of restriction endonuclease-like (RecB) superfamily
MMAKRSKSREIVPAPPAEYVGLVSGISELLDSARRSAARCVNSILTATYWEIGRRVVEFEQGGKARAEYGEELLDHLAQDLTAKHGRGFSARSLRKMRTFYVGWEIWPTASAKFEAWVKLPPNIGKGNDILPTPSAEFEPHDTTHRLGGMWDDQICPTASGKSEIAQIQSAQLNPIPAASIFPLSWSHYVRLMAVEKPHARAFYEAEAIRGGWSVRQLDRQISTQFFERTSHSKQQAAILVRGRRPKPEDAVSVQDEIRDPCLLEFLDLKDEYSESDLEEALVRHLEWFLLELGTGFTFVARQKRIRIGDEWYRIDLLLFHRRLRCLMPIDLKIGKFTHADAGQMNLYLNYLRENMMEPGENDPVGLILCSAKNDAVAHYAMGGIKAQVFASHYLTDLPDPETLKQEILTTQHALEARAAMKGQKHG